MAKPVNWNDVDMLTPGMKNLGNQFNKRWPRRDGASDGAIGNYAHTQEKSGHNPDDTSAHNAEWDGDSDNKPEIRAIDVDNDLNDPDVSFQMVIDHMRKLPGLDKVIRYMIYNRKIYRAPDFNPETYNGASAHTEHGHFSGAYSESADQNNKFDYKFDELGDDMPTADEVAQKVWAYPMKDPANGVMKNAAAFQMYNDVVNINAANLVINALKPALTTLLSKVDLDPNELAAIKATLAIPSAEENAAATVAALGSVDVDTLAQTLRNALSPENLESLKAAL